MTDTAEHRSAVESLEPVWDRLTHLDQDLGGVKTDVAKIAAQVEAGFTGLNASLRRLEQANDDRIRRLENANDAGKSPTVWVAIATLVLAVVGAAAAFQSQGLENLRRENELTADLERQREDNLRLRMEISDRRVDELAGNLGDWAELVYSAPSQLAGLEGDVAELRAVQLSNTRENSEQGALLTAAREDIRRLYKSDERSRNEADQHRSSIAELRGRFDAMRESLAQLSEPGPEVQQALGRLAALEHRVEAIDNIGSRFRAQDQGRSALPVPPARNAGGSRPVD